MRSKQHTDGKTAETNTPASFSSPLLFFCVKDFSQFLFFLPRAQTCLSRNIDNYLTHIIKPSTCTHYPRPALLKALSSDGLGDAYFLV